MRFESDKQTAMLGVLLCAIILLSIVVEACSGGTHSVIALPRLNERVKPSEQSEAMVIYPRNLKFEHMLERAIIHAKGRYKQILIARLYTESHQQAISVGSTPPPPTSQYGDDTALIGGTYALGFYYLSVPAQCGMLKWTYKTTMPNVHPTYNPPETGPTGTEVISYKVPSNLPPGTVYTAQAQGSCTTPSPSPAPIILTDQAVALNAIDVNQNGTKSVVITSTSIPKVLGQYINLVASPAPATTLFGIYTVSQDDPLATYTETPTYANWADYSSVYGQSFNTPPNVSFYYATTSDETMGVTQNWHILGQWYTLFCHGNYQSCFYGNQFVYPNYVIYAPTNVSISMGAPGPILATEAPQLVCAVGLVFGIANQPNESCNSSAGTGINWTFEATGPATNTSAQASLGGELDMTQLITLTNSMQPLVGATNVPAVPPDASMALDLCIRYGTADNEHTPVSASKSATFTSNDSPGTPLQKLWLTYTRGDVFNDYFVYKLNDMSSTPISKDNIWVVLGDGTWGWTGTARQATPTPKPTRTPIWSVRSSNPTPIPSAEVAAQQPPVWISGYNSTASPAPSCPPGG